MQEDLYEEDYTLLPLAPGSKLFKNDEKRTQLDKNEDYSPRDFRKASFYSYAWGYKDAADKLSYRHSENETEISLVYPIIFLYRQYLELILKDLILWGNKNIGENKDFSGHSLEDLWNNFYPSFKTIASDILKSNRDEIEAVKACILEFNSVDIKSDTFRYPLDIKKNRHFIGSKNLPGIQYIDISHFKTVMDSIEQFFMNVSMEYLMYKKA